VLGWCGDAAFPVGTVFHVLHAAPAAAEPTLHHAGNGDAEVQLAVAGILAYDREWPELQPGMSAKLVLQGTGAALIQPGMVLGSTRPKPFMVHDAQAEAARSPSPAQG
jgi:hypothetical protein